MCASVRVHVHACVSYEYVCVHVYAEFNSKFVNDFLHTQPSTNKLHNIIEKTALFISQQGTQMEIRIKINQKNNPYFAFMDFNDRLHPYYKHLLRAISSGNYTPKPQVEQKVEITEKTNGAQQLEQKVDTVEEAEEGSEDEESDGEYELHPLLMGSRTASNNKNTTSSTSQLSSSANGHSGSVILIVSEV